MAIEFSDITSLSKYPEPSFTKPAPLNPIYSIALGGDAVGDNTNGVATTYYMVDQEGGSVKLRKANGGSWGGATNLFSFVTPLDALSLVFDNKGDYTLAYTAMNTLYVRYNNNGIQVVNIPQASQPKLVHNLPQFADDIRAETYIFYVKNNTVYYRGSSDDYTTEYQTSITSTTEVVLLNVGIDVRNRIQIEYIARGDN